MTTYVLLALALAGIVVLGANASRAWQERQRKSETQRTAELLGRRDRVYLPPQWRS